MAERLRSRAIRRPCRQYGWRREPQAHRLCLLSSPLSRRDGPRTEGDEVELLPPRSAGATLASPGATEAVVLQPPIERAQFGARSVKALPTRCCEHHDGFSAGAGTPPPLPFARRGRDLRRCERRTASSLQAIEGRVLHAGDGGLRRRDDEAEGLVRSLGTAPRARSPRLVSRSPDDEAPLDGEVRRRREQFPPPRGPAPARTFRTRRRPRDQRGRDHEHHEQSPGTGCASKHTGRRTRSPETHGVRPCSGRA